jgi:hypothetical protein
MNEHDALIATAVRAVETSDRERALWSDAERAWASRAAAEVVGEGARPEAFLARRAALAFERLGARHAALRKVVRGVRWRGWIGPAIALVAFVAGVAIDRIGAGQRINVLAPPVLVLVAWNLSVYVWLLVAPVVRATRRSDAPPGPLRHAIVQLAGHLDRIPRRDASTPLGAAIATFVADWSRRAAPLYYARAARILHVSAAALAAGVIVGLYLRGLALEYRATWESTFLDAATVHRILDVLLWPGALVTGIAPPSVDELAAIRSSAAPASENAARWLHLYAATVAVIVIAPRLVLALFAWAFEQHRAANMRLPLAEPYFQRVLCSFQAGPARVTAIPYSYRLPQASLAGLQAVVSRAFGGSASLVCSSPVAYGDEERSDLALPGDVAGPVVAVFNLAATPERAAHVAFVQALRTAAGAHPLIVLVDEAPFREHVAGDAKRIDERRAAWREVFGERGIDPVFADLAVPDLAAIETAFEARVDAAAAR